MISAKPARCCLAAKDALLLPAWANPDTSAVFVDCKNEDPQFKDVFKNDFNLKATSPCRNFSTSGFPAIDIAGFSRSNNPTDCGAYLFQ